MSTRTVGMGWVIAAAAVTLWLANLSHRNTRVRRPQTTVPGTNQVNVHEDCVVSECGPDGVPLSLYAG